MKTEQLRPLGHLKGVIGVILGLVIISPLVYGLSISLMPQTDIITYPPKLFPTTFSLESYIKVFSTIPILRFILNSLIVSLAVIAMQMITSSLAAYGFVFFDFPLRKALFIAILATMMIPGEATIISNYLTMASAGLINSYPGLILPYCASAMAIFMIRQNYLSMPKELREAALIDGCGDMKFFFSILFPLSLPVVSALAVYTFIDTWNMFMWPLLITNTSDMRTVQIGVDMLKFADGINYGTITAGCCVVIVPSIVMFVLGHRRMVTGITAGSVKG